MKDDASKPADAQQPQSLSLQERRKLLDKRDRMEAELVTLARRTIAAENKLLRTFHRFEQLRKQYSRLERRLAAVRLIVPGRRKTAH